MTLKLGKNFKRKIRLKSTWLLTLQVRRSARLNANTHLVSNKLTHQVYIRHHQQVTSKIQLVIMSPRVV